MAKVRHVLLIEDVEEMLLMMEGVLNSISNLKVMGMAKNGAEARLVLRKNRPDLVFLDEILPGESSLDLLELFQLEEIPVILMTSVENASHPIPERVLGRIEKPNWKNIDQAKGQIEEILKLSAS